MRTYADLLKWANHQKRLPIEAGSRLTDNFRYIFDLPISSEREIDYPLLEKVQVGEGYYSILYFKGESFSLYYSGEDWDYSHWIFNESIWRKAREYVFKSLCVLEPSFPKTTPLEADIEPIEGGYVWGYLPKEERPIFFKATQSYVTWLDEFQLTGFGYTKELAVDDLMEQTINIDGQFIGELVVEQVQHED